MARKNAGTHAKAWEGAERKVNSVVLPDEVLEASEKAFNEAVRKKANCFEQFSSDIQYRSNAIACVAAVEAHVGKYENQKGHPLWKVTEEIRQSEQILNASKMVWKGSYTTKAPEGHELRASLEELKRIKEDIIEAGVLPIVEHFEMNSYAEAKEIKEKEDKLWEQQKAK